MGSILEKEKLTIRFRLWTAIVLLTAATSVLATISYAWFSISTVPEVKAVLTRVTSNGNLEIALGGVEPPASTTIMDGDITELTMLNKTWGNIVDLNSEVYTQLGEVVLLPISKTDEGFGVPVYNEDGRMSSLTPLQFSEETDEDGITIVKSEDATYMYYVSLWLRSNTTGNVVLVTEPGTPRVLDHPMTEGKGSCITMANALEQTDEENSLMQSIKISFTDEDGDEITRLTADKEGNLLYEEDSNPYIYQIDESSKDKPIRIQMCVYLEGKDLTNAAMAPQEEPLKGTINIQFAMEGELSPMREDLVEN